jgi:ketosteroid isomerase-like protein
MKIRLTVALVGLAISFALPTFAQQTNTPDPQLRQQIVALTKKFDDAMNNNDAAARAALYTEDAVEVTDHGPIFGREAIEKWYADLLQKVHFSNHVLTDDQDSPHIIGRAGNQVWETGGWSCTIQGKDWGPTQLKGYRSVIREGDDLKIRMLIWNITPAPPATGAATPSPTTTPSNQ